MEVKAELRYAKISAFKVREVTREIQGLPAEQALEIVRLIPKKAARMIGKTLASAIANAENNNKARSSAPPVSSSRKPSRARAPRSSACTPAPVAAGRASTSAPPTSRSS